MKKEIVFAVLMFFAFIQTQAQVTFKPGIRGGANFSHFTKGSDYYYNDYYYDGIPDPTVDNGSNNTKFSSNTDFYFGFYGALKLTKYYTLQPEVTYSNQGSKLRYVDQYNGIVMNEKYDVSYLSIAIVNKFSFSEKFNIHIAPTIDFVVDNNFDTENNVDLAFILGTGYNFTKNFGIEARVKKGIVPVLYIPNSGSDHTNVVFSVGVTYTFDLK